MVARRKPTQFQLLRERIKEPRIPEAVLHAQIARVLAIELAPPGKISAQGATWWSQDIANYGGTTPGLRTTRGVIAGVPDCLVLYRGRGHFIELKAPDGRLSVAQQDVGAAILLAGAHFGVARSIEEVLELLDCWEIPRARRLRIAGKEA